MRAFPVAALVACVGCAGVDLPEGGADAGHAHADFASSIDRTTIADQATSHDFATSPSDFSTVNAFDLTSVLDFSSVAQNDLTTACAPQTTPCDVICQNCGGGQKCGSSSGMPICEANGTVADNMVCGSQGTDDCVIGDVCIAETSTYSKCMPFCRTDGDCKNGGRCTDQLSNSSLMLCSDAITNCTLVPNSGCATGQGCYPVVPDGSGGCHLAGTGVVGATCNTDYDCKAGLACFTTGCLKLCRPGMSDCAVGKTCDTTATGWASTGVCL